MFLTNPESMTDEEIVKDLEAASRAVPDIMADERMSAGIKGEFESHVRGLLQEYEKRTNKKWTHPLSSFGIADSWSV